jgi:hypothetical protein
MLTLTHDQMNAFAVASIATFSDKLSGYLITTYPSICAAMGGEAAIQTFIAANLPRAASWGIDSADGVTALFELLLQYGTSFERSPAREWSMNILSHPVMAGDVKVDLVRERHNQLTEGRPIVRR